MQPERGSAAASRGTRPVQPGRWLRRVCTLNPGSGLPRHEDLDAGLLLHLARVHRLESVAGARVAALSGRHPAWMRHLVAAWRRNLGDQALFRQVMAEISGEAAARGLPVLALKGADLAQRVYGPGERSSNDLDLLVPPERLAEMESLLGTVGFRCDHREPLNARKHWFASTYRLIDRPRVQVDLHWGLGTPGRVHWDLPALFERAEDVPGCEGLLRMEVHDLLVYLALHAVAFHGAAGRWVWWLDLHRLVTAGEIGRSELVSRARDVGGSVSLGAGLERARELFAPAASSLLKTGWRSRVITRLGRRLEDRSAGRAGRWLVAALAVDQPANLGRIALGVCRRLY